MGLSSNKRGLQSPRWRNLTNPSPEQNLFSKRTIYKNYWMKPPTNFGNWTPYTSYVLWERIIRELYFFGRFHMSWHYKRRRRTLDTKKYIIRDASPSTYHQTSREQIINMSALQLNRPNSTIYAIQHYITILRNELYWRLTIMNRMISAGIHVVHGWSK